jgi:hypothetical protein
VGVKDRGRIPGDRCAVKGDEGDVLLKAVLTCKDFEEVKKSVLDDHGDPELFLLTL